MSNSTLVFNLVCWKLVQELNSKQWSSASFDFAMFYVLPLREKDTQTSRQTKSRKMLPTGALPKCPASTCWCEDQTYGEVGWTKPWHLQVHGRDGAGVDLTRQLHPSVYVLAVAGDGPSLTLYWHTLTGLKSEAILGKVSWGTPKLNLLTQILATGKRFWSNIGVHVSELGFFSC